MSRATAGLILLDGGGPGRIMEVGHAEFGVRSLKIRGRTRIDRMSEVAGGVSRLVSWPRKKPTKL